MNTLAEQLTRVCELLKEIKRLEFNYNTVTIPQLAKGVLFGVEFGSYLSLNKFRYFTFTHTHTPHTTHRNQSLFCVIWMDEMSDSILLQCDI